MNKTKFAGLMGELKLNYPSAKVEPREWKLRMRKFFKVMTDRDPDSQELRGSKQRFSDEVIERAFEIAEDKHRIFFPGSGEIVEHCESARDELERKKGYAAQLQADLDRKALPPAINRPFDEQIPNEYRAPFVLMGLAKCNECGTKREHKQGECGLVRAEL